MLGRTHMAIGVCAATVAAPILFHVPHAMRLLQDITHFSFPTSAAKEVILITASAIGSYVPDLDQQDSIAARRVEPIGRVVAVVALILMFVAMHLTTSPVAWAGAAMIAFAVVVRRNIARQIALGLMVAVLLYLGVTGHVQQGGATLLAVWGIGAIFTKHRTFTHSIFGAFVFLTGMHLVLGTLYSGVPFLGIAIGYVLHICADFVADGTALFWPYRKRIGFPLVKTGGIFDKLIGAIATVLFVVNVVRL